MKKPTGFESVPEQSLYEYLRFHKREQSESSSAIARINRELKRRRKAASEALSEDTHQS